VTGFLGPNGAGKTTIMWLILGLDSPDAGTATIDGRPYRSLRRPLHQVGSLLEAAAIHPGRTARGHLLALARANWIGRRRVAEVLIGDPPVLLLDEPVNGLDSRSPSGVELVWQGDHGAVDF
jgi:ABC-2 type transport system ATP-binding protein